MFFSTWATTHAINTFAASFTTLGSGSINQGSGSGSGVCEMKLGLTCDDYLRAWYQNSSNTGSMNCSRLEKEYDIDCSDCACNYTRVDNDIDDETTTTTSSASSTPSTPSTITTTAAVVTRTTTTTDGDNAAKLSTTTPRSKNTKFAVVGKTNVEGVDLLNNPNVQKSFEKILKDFHKAESVICQYSENKRRGLRYLQRMLNTQTGQITVDYTLVYSDRDTAETALKDTFTTTKIEQDLAKELAAEDPVAFGSVKVSVASQPTIKSVSTATTVTMTPTTPAIIDHYEFNWLLLVIILICVFVFLVIIGITGYCLCRFYSRKAGAGASGVKWTSDDHDQAYYDDPIDNKRKSKKKGARRDTYSAPPPARRISTKKSSGLSTDSGYVDAFST